MNEEMPLPIRRLEELADRLEAIGPRPRLDVPKGSSAQDHVMALSNYAEILGQRQEVINEAVVIVEEVFSELKDLDPKLAALMDMFDPMFIAGLFLRRLNEEGDISWNCRELSMELAMRGSAKMATKINMELASEGFQNLLDEIHTLERVGSVAANCVEDEDENAGR